jgi:hypothetical protein
MGVSTLFGKRKSREEKAQETVDKIASGKGLLGRTTRAFLGAEGFAAVQQSVGAYNSAANVQQLVAAGVPTVPAIVVSIADTGQMVNYDPVVNMVVQPVGSPQPIQLQTLVSKLQVPRAGERVLLVANPQVPGAYLYAGTA